MMKFSGAFGPRFRLYVATMCEAPLMSVLALDSRLSYICSLPYV